MKNKYLKHTGLTIIHKRIKVVELLDSFRNCILLDAGYKGIQTHGNISTEGNKLFSKAVVE
jgi:hypothetical protein